MPGAFVQIKKYGGTAGSNHLRHDFREKTRRELEGRIKVIGDYDGFREHLKIPPLRRNQKTDYMEIVAYPENNEQAMAILEYLKNELNRPVVGVWHYDESTPHVHFLVPWRDKDGRALRLQKSQLRNMKKAIAHMVGREITPPGQGRTKIPTRVWYMDPEYFRSVAIAEQKRMEEARRWIGYVARLYGPIAIYGLRRGVGTVPIMVAGMKKSGELWDADKNRPLNLRRLFAVNRAGDELVFKPRNKPYSFRMRGGADNEPMYDFAMAVFLDDVPVSRITQLPEKCILVETSPGKFQAHFYVSFKVEQSAIDDVGGFDEFAKLVQKSLVYYFEADQGSVDLYHLRKLPGFRNTKYDDAPQVRIVARDKYDIENAITNDDVLKIVGDSYINYVEHRKVAKRVFKSMEQPANKTWADFYYEARAKGKVDLSVVDMKYAVYLASHGVDADVIRDALMAESKDIAIRKRGHLDDYLDRTVNKALAFAHREITAEVHHDVGIEM
ncbi:MAG: hypothetical protein GXO25_07170 [Euryarchaeota archaeon]|nr:hypothetical protein [Euryarchaeota archaeon]